MSGHGLPFVIEGGPFWQGEPPDGKVAQVHILRRAGRAVEDAPHIFQEGRVVKAYHARGGVTVIMVSHSMDDVARLCSRHVVVPDEVGCCGFAGDRGFTHPEVNAYALRKLRPQLEKAGVKTGYSNSRTCEIGLTTNSGIPYLSIVYLVDQCTTPKK